MVIFTEEHNFLMTRALIANNKKAAKFLNLAAFLFDNQNC